MPRPLRIQTPGFYHVTTRGNNGAPIYHDEDDRRFFVRVLKRTGTLLEWQVHLWCLMTNHFHLLIETKFENLARGMHRLNSIYSHAFIDRHGGTGHVFERRYFSKPIESDRQYAATALYILHNPGVAGLQEDPNDRRTGGRMLELELRDR